MKVQHLVGVVAARLMTTDTKVWYPPACKLAHSHINGDCQKGAGVKSELIRVVDTLPGSVWTALPDGHVDFLNQRWCQYTGLSVEEGCGQGWQAAVHPENLPEVLASWQMILQGGESGELEARLRRADGEYRWILVRASPLADVTGKIVKWCGVNTDIEDRKRAEEALRVSEGRFRRIIDGLPTIVSLRTLAGHLEFANRQFLEYFGGTLEELKGWGDTFHVEDRDRVLAAWKESVDTGNPWDLEARHRRFDGVYRWFHMRGFPLRDANGQVVQWYLLHTDIDDRRRAETLLAGEKQLLEMVARGQAMTAILAALCLFIEGSVSGCYCSVVLVDRNGTHLEDGAAPSLPASFTASIVGRPVNAESGPCAMAAYLNEQVIATDLTSESRWAEYEWCPMALSHGLHACWSTPIQSSAGKILGAFAIYYPEPKTPTPQDEAVIDQITHIASIAIERALGDAAMRSSEVRKAAILDSALDCIVTIDHEGTVIEFNPAAEQTFGYLAHEVMGERMAEVMIPSLLEHQDKREFALSLANGNSTMLGRRVELTAVRANGNEFPVEVAVTRIPLDGPPSFTCYVRDITERQEAEEKLRRSGAYLAEAQKLSLTGSFGWSVYVDRHFWSEETFRIFDYDIATKITLQLILARVHPQDISLMRRVIALADGRDFDFECRLSMPDGFVKHLHFVAHGTRDREGQLEYIGAVQDVTERRQSEQALGKVRSELAHVSRVMSLGALTASIAHEVNQPLSGIITNASTCLRMLGGEPPNLDGARETVRRIIRDGNRASDVTARLRALFSKKEVTNEPLDLNEAAQEVIALSRSELQVNQVVVHTVFASDLPAVMGDRVQLQQVILNLLLNASDAMSDVDDRPRRLMVVTEHYAGDEIRLTVQDTGVGFELQSAERLFDAFYTTKRGGMGIGLSISRSIVESHRGRLWAAPNEEGPGATFCFSLPRGQGQLMPSHSRSVMRESGLRPIPSSN